MVFLFLIVGPAYILLSKKNMSTRTAPRIIPVAEVELEVWEHRSYCAALAMECWRGNEEAGLTANSAMIVTESAGMPRLPVELWIDICQWMMMTKRLAMLRIYFNDVVPRQVNEIRRVARIYDFFHDPVQTVRRAFQLHRECVKLWETLNTIHLGCYVLHARRDIYITLMTQLEADPVVVEGGFLEMFGPGWREQVAWTSL